MQILRCLRNERPDTLSSLLSKVTSVWKQLILESETISDCCRITDSDGGPYHIETSPLICRPNQLTGFYMIETVVIKELNLLSSLPYKDSGRLNKWVNNQIKRKWMAAFFNEVYGKMWVGVFLKSVIRRCLFSNARETIKVPLKTGTRDFKNSPPFKRKPYFYIWQSLGILNVFINLTLKKIYKKTRTFFEKLENILLVERATMENATFPYKLPCQKPMLRQIE